MALNTTLQERWSILSASDRDRCSRAYTLIAALAKLGIEDSRTALTIHIVGATSREEGGCASETVSIFKDALQLLGEAGVQRITLVLVGEAFRGQKIPIHESAAVESCHVDCMYVAGLYHEVNLVGPLAKADAVISYQPGIWGYESWGPSVKRALDDFEAPFIFTSYNYPEADLDADKLQELQFDEAYWNSPGWTAEKNPFSAHTGRTCAVNDGTPLTEQDWWQCLVPRTMWSAGSEFPPEAAPTNR
mmetsp:Transcript_31019/g.65825  ORF Transcript_31019/g.65825 Transcript_31019/m.65825 type:complete len:247 (+) Transcript_31019:79-819(+)